MIDAVWSRDATPDQIRADREWEDANWRRINGCRECGMPVPPHYWDAEIARLKHKADLLRSMTPRPDRKQDVTQTDGYKALVLETFRRMDREEKRDIRDRKAQIEYAGRKRL